MTASRIQVSTAYQKWRKIKDQLARYGIVAGGLGIIVAIGLIFFYLMYVVYPLFISAQAHELTRYQVPEAATGKTLFLISEEQNEVAVRFTDQGKAVFFAVDSGAVLKTESVGVPDGVAITSFTVGSPAQGFVAYGLDNGGVIVVRHKYRITYPNDKRLITPQLEFPFGEEALQIDPQGQAIIDIAFRSNESGTTFAARTADQRVLLTNFSKEESLFSDDDSFERINATLDVNAKDLAYLMLDKEQRNLYLATQDGDLSLFNISDKQHPVLVQHTQIINVGEQLTSLVFLTGELSLLAGDNKGFVSQWSLVRDAMNHYSLQKLRVFKVSELPVMAIAAEQRRKGFMVIDADGVAGVYHSTAERQLLTEKVTPQCPSYW
ncbi:binding-protein-dependent transport systems inner membrane component [methanotrophic bacterial endosymbiont of Bathymodiolus sp.]|nr:binding-protein-dependent transport systems inner membrane component [methanotrophic bacterial endosymbiont of Bathymodiolus sp.]